MSRLPPTVSSPSRAPATQAAIKFKFFPIELTSQATRKI
jgi:hypothetical protein